MEIEHIRIEDIEVVDRSRKDLGDLDSLADSIEKIGLLHPIVVSEERRLISGERRLEALKLLEWEDAPCVVSSSIDTTVSLLIAERDENVCRKDLTPSEAVKIGREIEKEERKAAKERQGTRTDKHRENFSQSSRGKTRDKVGAAVGMSGPTYSKAKEVIEAAEEDPELQFIVDEMDETGNVSRAHRRLAVSANTGEFEWYTPSEYIEMAREVMKRIDVDPASCDFANEAVKAKKYFTIDDDGLEHEWKGNVWMNPPYSSESVASFIDKLIEEVEKGNVTQFIVLVNNATDTGWFARIVEIVDLACFKTGRVAFVNRFGQSVSGAAQGQVFLYYGKAPNRFARVFGEIGWIVKVL